MHGAGTELFRSVALSLPVTKKMHGPTKDRDEVQVPRPYFFCDREDAQQTTSATAMHDRGKLMLCIQSLCFSALNVQCHHGHPR